MEFILAKCSAERRLIIQSLHPDCASDRIDISICHYLSFLIFSPLFLCFISTLFNLQHLQDSGEQSTLCGIFLDSRNCESATLLIFLVAAIVPAASFAAIVHCLSSSRLLDCGNGLGFHGFFFLLA